MQCGPGWIADSYVPLQARREHVATGWDHLAEESKFQQRDRNALIARSRPPCPTYFFFKSVMYVSARPSPVPSNENPLRKGFIMLRFRLIIGALSVSFFGVADVRAQAIPEPKGDCVVTAAGTDPLCLDGGNRGVWKDATQPRWLFEEDSAPIVPRLYRSDEAQPE